MKSRDPQDAYEFMTDRERSDWRGRFGDDREARKSDLVDLALHVHAESGKAFLLSDDGVKDHAKWAPKSLIEPSGGIYTMPEWLARERGWL